MSKNPFPGPKPYRAADKDHYPGRNELALRLENTILASRCVTVHGPSGAGKSSIMQAQVLPRLENPEGERARVIEVDGWPENEEPIQWLAREFYNDLGFGSPTTEVFEEGKVRPVSFRESIMLAAKRATLGSSRLVIVYLDQIEQLLYSNRKITETDAFFDTLNELASLPLPTMRIILSLREDYLGKLRDRLRDKRRIFDCGFRVGPLTVLELAAAMCVAATKGEPPQAWNKEETRQLMLQVRVKGQPVTDEAEGQAAFAQIVCRALFQQNDQGEVGASTNTAETIVQNYLESVLAGLGELRPSAERMLEENLVTPDGGRTLRTEDELRHLASDAQLDSILRSLEDAAILQAAQHHGSRYFELGHDWLARRLSERRNERRAREAEEIRRKELETEKRRRIDAEDQTLMAGFLALKASDPGMALKFLSEVRHPEKHPNWVAHANAALELSTVHITLSGDHAVFSPDGQRVAINTHRIEVWILNVDGQGMAINLPMFGRPAGWSPDGTRLLVGTTDGGVIWPVDAAGTSVKIERPVSESHFDGQFSPDGNHIVLTNEGQSPCVFDIEGKLVAELQVPEGERLTHVHFLPRDLRLVTGSDNGAIRVWDAAANWQSFQLFDGGSTITSFILAPTGSGVIVAFADGFVRGFIADEPSEPIILRRDVEPLGPMSLCPDGSRLAVGDANGQIHIYPLDSGDEPLVFPGHNGSVKLIAYAPTSMFLASSAEDRTIRIWGRGRFVDLHGHRNPPEELVWSLDGTLLATSSFFEQKIKLWKTATLTDNPRKLSSYSRILIASIHSEKRLVLTLAPDRNVLLHQLPQVDPPLVEQFVERSVGDIALSPDGDRFWAKAYGDSETIYVYSLLENTPPIVLHVVGEKPYFHAAWSPDGQRIATGSQFGKVRIFKADSSEPPLVLQGYDEKIAVVEWSPDGTFLLAASTDGKLLSYRTDGMSNPVVLKENFFNSIIKFDATGRRVAIATDEGLTGILAADGSGDLVTLGKVNRPRDVVWSKNDKYIAESTWDNRIIVFFTDGQRPALRFDTRSEIVAFSFIDDDRKLLVVLRDNGIHIWRLEIEDLQEALRCAHVDCVPAEIRSMILGESEAVAQYKYELQLSRYGRVPAPQDPPPEE